MKTAKSLLALIVSLAVLTLQMDLVASPKEEKIRAQLESFPIGSSVELYLSSGTNIIGKLDRLDKDTVTLQVREPKNTREITYRMGDIAEVAMSASTSARVTPESLYAVIQDENVDLMTRDGTYVRGKVVGADAEKIWIEVRQCEPKGRYKGRVMVAASDISVVHMKKGGSIAASVGLGAAGGFGGLFAGLGVWVASDGGAVAWFAPIIGMVGGIAGGAYGGQAISKKKVTINVSDPQEKDVRQNF
jgi:ribosome maturation factor RimP